MGADWSGVVKPAPGVRFRPMSTPINRNQAVLMRWYEEYLERRYLADTPGEAVVQRARELISNICTLEPNGRIGAAYPRAQSGSFLWRLFSHVLEESRPRTGDYQGLFIRHGLRDAAIPRATSPDPPASEAVLRISRERTGHRRLFKLGQKKWMHALLDHGRICIAPASMYQDPSLGPAIADDELSYDLATAAFDADILSPRSFPARLPTRSASPRLRPAGSAWRRTTTPSVRALHSGPGCSATSTTRTPSWSYMTRLSSPGGRYRPSATRCMAGRSRPARFMTSTRTTRRSRPGTSSLASTSSTCNQEEFRYVFLPPSPVTRLEPISLDLGSLRDIAEAPDR